VLIRAVISFIFTGLAPEYEKAATLLKGIVKIVAVDATAAQSLASKYQIQGFPTIKIFGADKKSPTDYQGERTADAIVTAAMKATTQLVKDRKVVDYLFSIIFLF
jgi:protein disulfide-isomerase A6